MLSSAAISRLFTCIYARLSAKTQTGSLSSILNCRPSFTAKFPEESRGAQLPSSLRTASVAFAPQLEVFSPQVVQVQQSSPAARKRRRRLVQLLAVLDGHFQKEPRVEERFDER